MNAIQHKYPYAINDDGLPIFIDEVNQDNRRQTHYHCYGCGAELFPVLGRVREHHFRHAKDAVCDPNKYFHEYSKATIKKRFDESDTFIVKFKATQKCKKYNDCEFTNYNWPECNHFGFYELDLKKFYDTCTSEKGYYVDLPEGKKKYIADLKLTHSTNNIKPVTIEIWVTHECTEDKKLNGGHIIEIKVNREDDAYREIVQSDDESLPIRFFNFRKQIDIEPSINFIHVFLPDDKQPVKYETSCAEGVNFELKGKQEVVFSHVEKGVRILESLYFSVLNEKGISIPDIRLCARGRIERDKKDNREKLYCNYYYYKCPCQDYIYSSEKAKALIEKNKPYWEKTEE
ncbi:MAG: hypothetical protein J6Y82_00455 [Bacteroidales bacterium]|nr:hypothetical protein [Bacteroidales bacterium]